MYYNGYVNTVGKAFTLPTLEATVDIVRSRQYTNAGYISPIGAHVCEWI